MSISEREQEALDSIENDLVGSGPELASKLAIFVRLAVGEEMPKRERIRRSVYPSSASAAAARASTDTGVSAHAGASTDAERASARRVARWLSRRTAWRLLWLVVAIALMAFLLTVDRDAGKGICTTSRTAACRQAPAPAHSSAGTAGGL